MNTPRIRRALISVSHKEGLTPFAQALAEHDIEIYSTGGTRRHLEQAGLAVSDISAYTGFPEMMGGRLKTLHPRVFGGILARHNVEGDMQVLAQHGISTFELVVVNLYPFAQTIAQQDVTRAEAIEQIDIGGPSLLRAAAKNHQFVSVVTHSGQYDFVLAEIAEQGGTTLTTRVQLAAAAFAHTADYDRLIADYFAASASAGSQQPPPEIRASWKRTVELRYGENPHQLAALYVDPGGSSGQLVKARQLNGKELSYNNYLDLDAAWSLVRRFQIPTATVIKHGNPCGAGTAESLAEATQKALSGDPLSAFGSIVGCNRVVDSATAEVLTEPGLFIEAIVAPDFDPAALELLQSRPKWKKNVRLMQVGDVGPFVQHWHLRQIDGGLLVQSADHGADPKGEWLVTTTAKPTDQQLWELNFAWELVRHVKSNAIVITRDGTLVGVGAGQMSRVDAVEIAIRKAAGRTRGAVLASDAFFPFPDSIHQAATAGIDALIQPGGSRKDDEVMAACNEHQMPMILTGRRHFRH